MFFCFSPVNRLMIRFVSKTVREAENSSIIRILGLHKRIRPI